MLKKQAKLKTIDLIKLKKEGKRVYTTLFSVNFTPENETKFAVSVPKKVYKLAVDRNKAKRKIFAVLEGISPSKTGFYEIFVKSPINLIPNDKIRVELEQVLCQK